MDIKEEKNVFLKLNRTMEEAFSKGLIWGFLVNLGAFKFRAIAQLFMKDYAKNAL